MNPIFYKPENAWAGDPFPFLKDGTYYLYYLLDWREKAANGESVPSDGRTARLYLITTRDMVHFVEHGQMLACGSVDEADAYVGTGSVVEGLGQYHMFYTGYNPHYAAQGRQATSVLHAVSTDLLNWEKVPGDTFNAPVDTFEPNDWKDPFPFWNEEAGEFWMLVCARLKTGPARRRGCTALCTSKDLRHWQVQPKPFYAPGLFNDHDCADLFRMGDWWYLFFSEYSEQTVTRYRRARSLAGPWLTPAIDTCDGRALYAGKTAGDGANRYLFGWIPTREGSKDYRPWQWGGALVVHQLWQKADGTLAVRPPRQVVQTFSIERACTFQPGLGESRITPQAVELDAAGSLAFAGAGLLPASCKIQATIVYQPDTRGCGLALRTSEDFESGYYIRLEPAQQRLVFDAWPRPGDQPFMIGLERSIHLEPNTPIRITVLVEGTICVVYVNGETAMSARMYDLTAGNWGVFAQQGAARFTDVSLAERMA
jgi:beta-fructofuranosidase